MAELIERFIIPENSSESSLNGYGFLSPSSTYPGPRYFMNQAFASLPKVKRLDILEIRSFNMMRTITWRSRWCRKVSPNSVVNSSGTLERVPPI